jgi:hypothetical protein
MISINESVRVVVSTISRKSRTFGETRKRLASRIQYLMPLHPPISEYLEGSKFYLCLWNVGLRGVLMSSAENSFMELGP